MKLGGARKARRLATLSLAALALASPSYLGCASPSENASPTAGRSAAPAPERSEVGNTTSPAPRAPSSASLQQPTSTAPAAGSVPAAPAGPEPPCPELEIRLDGKSRSLPHRLGRGFEVPDTRKDGWPTQMAYHIIVAEKPITCDEVLAPSREVSPRNIEFIAIANPVIDETMVSVWNTNTKTRLTIAETPERSNHVAICIHEPAKVQWTALGKPRTLEVRGLVRGRYCGLKTRR